MWQTVLVHIMPIEASDHDSVSIITAAVCPAEKQEGSAIEEFQPVTYNYSFFHLIFALASCYIAMLMTGWGTGAEERDLIDVGWVSVWVKIVTQWLTAAVYCWMLVAPTILEDRSF